MLRQQVHRLLQQALANRPLYSGVGPRETDYADPLIELLLRRKNRASMLPAMIKDLIYDVGMHNGSDTAFYLHRGFRVIAIEANPRLAEEARQRFAQAITAGRLTILNLAISASSEPLPFWICDDHSEWSSFDRQIAAREGSRHHAIEVECSSLDSILVKYGIPFYLKIDIEGNDALCVDALRSADLPAYLSLEAGDTEMLAKLESIGYTSFKCISQFNFLPVQEPPSLEQRVRETLERLLRSRRLAARVLRRLGGRQFGQRQLKRLGRVHGWTFPAGSSGPFGEDTPGRWQTRPELERTFARQLARMKAGESSSFWLKEEYSFWVDFHARH